MAHPKLVFYDFKTLLPGISLSTNTWRVRLVLNYKKLPFETIWVEGQDIETTCIAAGIPPLDKREDGSLRYTLPALVDYTNHDAPVRMCDSRRIVEYLERTYPAPNTERALFPPATHGLQKLADSYFERDVPPVSLSLLLPGMSSKVSERVRSSLEKYAPPGKTVAELEVQGAEREEEWNKLRAELDKFGAYAEGEVFFLGDTASYIDMHVLAALTVMRLVVGDEEFEKEVGRSAGGRWVKLVKSCADLVG